MICLAIIIKWSCPLNTQTFAAKLWKYLEEEESIFSGPLCRTDFRRTHEHGKIGPHTIKKGAYWGLTFKNVGYSCGQRPILIHCFRAVTCMQGWMSRQVGPGPLIYLQMDVTT